MIRFCAEHKYHLQWNNFEAVDLSRTWKGFHLTRNRMFRKPCRKAREPLIPKDIHITVCISYCNVICNQRNMEQLRAEYAPFLTITVLCYSGSSLSDGMTMHNPTNFWWTCTCDGARSGMSAWVPAEFGAWNPNYSNGNIAGSISARRQPLD